MHDLHGKDTNFLPSASSKGHHAHIPADRRAYLGCIQDSIAGFDAAWLALTAVVAWMEKGRGGEARGIWLRSKGGERLAESITDAVYFGFASCRPPAAADPIVNSGAIAPAALVGNWRCPAPAAENEMRPGHFCAFLATAALLCGCQTIQVENRTLRLANTLTDFHYREVLDNAAKVSCNPSTLPSYVLLNQGLANVQQTEQFNGTLNIDLITAPGRLFLSQVLDKEGVGTTDTQLQNEQWNLQPVQTPNQIELMRALYRRVLGVSTPEDETNLTAFFKLNPNRLAAVQPGCVCNGRKCDVPHGAAYVGHYRNCYVWVMPSGVECLSRLTLAVLDVATAASTNTPKSPQAASFLPDIFKPYMGSTPNEVETTPQGYDRPRLP